MSTIKNDYHVSGSDDFIKISYPDIAYVNLASCIGLSIMHFNSKSAYVCHAYPLESSKIEETLIAAKKDYKNKINIEVVIAGANKVSIEEQCGDDENTSLDSDWNVALGLVYKYFKKSQVRNERTKCYDQSTAIKTDCENCKTTVTHSKIEYHDLDEDVFQ